MSDQQSVSKHISSSPKRNREMLIDTLSSLRETSDEMSLKVYELRSLLQELKATRAEMERMKNDLNAAKEWGININTEKN